MPEAYYADDLVTLYHGDSLAVLRGMPDGSVDAVVTDPPYGLGFMGKEWDALPPGEEWARECLRVLKSGGHMLAFGGTRTWHRLAVAIEDAGFEVRDSIAWLYGSGFPKSLDVSKAIDKRPGVGRHAEFAAHLAERREATGLSRADVSEQVVGTRTGACWNWEHHQFPEARWWPALRDLLGLDDEKWGSVIAEAERQKIGTRTVGLGTGKGTVAIMGDGNRDLTANATPDAERWQGWGTALKPAFEPIVVARKPLAGTVAANVLAHGTGALNVDRCRVGADSTLRVKRGGANDFPHEDDSWTPVSVTVGSDLGRWPANVILDESQAAVLDEQSGELTSGLARSGDRAQSRGGEIYGKDAGYVRSGDTYGDTGGASRFFYVAKADASERVRVPIPEGDEERLGGQTTTRCVKCGKQRVNVGTSACACPEPEFVRERSRYISHPTVKPLALMRWLVRLVTPPGGTVLEPFAGSGTTVEACILEGFDCIAIEREADYLPLIESRIARRRDPVRAVELAGGDAGLFDLLDEEGA